MHWRLATDRTWGRETYRRRLCQLWEGSGVGRHSFSEAALCSVIPQMTELWRALLRELLGREPLVLHQRMKLDMALVVRRPQQVGMDRLADATAIRRRATGAAVCVDFGTATTFNVVDEQGRFRGGAIAPGLGTAAEILVKQAPALPEVALTAPDSAIGCDTDEALRSGIVLGHVGLVEGLLARIRDELEAPPWVIATGGLGHVVTPLTGSIDGYDRWLTLAGIRDIYRMNAG